MKKAIALITGKSFRRCLIAMTVLMNQPTLAATITTVGSGNWSSTTANAPWPGGTVPSAGDDIVIGNGHTLTVSSNATCNSISFTATNGGTASGTLSVSSGITLTVTTNINCPSAAAIVKNSGDYTISGSGAINCVNVNCNNANVPGASSITTINAISTITTLTVSGNINLYGTIGNGASGKLNNATFRLQSGTATINGSIISSHSNSSNVSTVDMVTSASSPTLILTGATPFSLSATGTSTMSFNGTESTVIYNYAGAQTVKGATYANLTLAGSGNKTTTGVTVNGILSMQGTAAAITTSPTFGSSSTLEYKGSSAQTATNIEFPSSSGPRSLIIDNANGVTLNGTKTLSSTLTFVNGKLNTGSYEINVTNSSASAVTGHSSSNYIIGNLRRSISTTGSYDFPLGTSSNYQFINATFTAQIGISNVLGTFTGTNPAPSGLPSTLTYNGKNYGRTLDHGYWSLTPNSAMIAGVYGVTLKGKGYTNALSAIVSDYVVIKRHDGSSSWAIGGLPDLLNQLLGGGILTTIATGLTSFSDFAEATTCDVTTAAAGPDQTVCGSSVTLAANTPTVGTGAWSIVSGTGGTFGNSASPASTFTGTAGGTYSLVWTISNNPCVASSDTVVIALKQTPTAANAGTDKTNSATCGLTQVTLGGNTPSAGTGAWSVISGTGGTFGNSASATSTFSGTAGTAYSLKWTISNSPCTASADTVLVTFNQSTTVNAGNTFTKTCISNASGAAIGESNDATASYAWTPATGLSSSNASNPTANPTVTTTYTVTKTKTVGGCTATATVTVTVNNTVPAVSAGSSFTKTCTSNASGATIGETNDATATYAWLPSAGLSSATVSNPAANPSVTTTYTLTKTAANGCTAKATATATVNTTLPTAGITNNTGTPHLKCGLSAINVTATGGTSYLWSGGTATTTAANSFPSPGYYTVIVTAANGCTSSTGIAIYNPQKSDLINGSLVICPGATGTYTAVLIPGVTSYSWKTSSPSISIISGQGTNTVVARFATNWTFGSLSIFGVYSCGADSLGTSIHLRSVPGTPSLIQGPASLCANNTADYSVSEMADYASSFTWAVPVGMSITSGQGTNSISVSTDASFTKGNVSVHGNNTCGAGVDRVLVVRSTPDAPAAIVGSGVICKNSTGSYSISPVNGITSYTWAASADMNITSGAGTNSITVSTTSTWTGGTISVSADGTCGTGEAKSLTLKSTLAAPATISGSLTVCANTSVTYSLAAINGATSYSWTVPTGMSISSGETTNSINVNISPSWSSGTLSVAAVNVCGASLVKTVALKTSVAQPSAIVGSATACPSGIKTYSVTSVPGATYSWTAANGATVTANNNNATVIFNTLPETLSVVGVSSCGMSPVRTLNINAATMPATPGAITVSGVAKACPGDTRTFSIAPVANATCYSWTVPEGATISGRRDTTSITVNFGSNFTIAGNVCAMAKNGCGSGPSKCLAIALNPPTVPGAITVTGGAAKVCPGESRTYSIAAVACVNNYTWCIPSTTAGITMNGSGTEYTGTQLSVPISFTSSFAAASVLLSVKSTNACGTSGAKTLSIARNTVVAPAAIVGPTSACPNTPGFAFSVPLVVNAASYVWSAPAGAIINNQGTNSVSVDFGTTIGAVTVASANACGNSAAKSKAITKVCTSMKAYDDGKGTSTAGDYTEIPADPTPPTTNPNPTTHNPQPITQPELQAPVFDAPNAFNLQVYPDAEAGNITMTFNADKAGVFKYKIYDSSENELMSGKVKVIEGVNMEQVDVTSLPKTVLTIKLEDGTTSTHVNVTMQ